MADNIKLFFYDPYTNQYLSSSLVSEEEKQRVTQNFSTNPVIDEKEGKLIVYDPKNDSWFYISEYCYQIDEDGFLIAKYVNPLPIESLTDDLIDEPLNKDYEKPRWNGSFWEDKPIPENLYSPKFDREKSEWVEGATIDIISNQIDAETNQIIATWCIEQTKCEEYYLNKGIENNTDPEYLAYKDAKNQIILAQRQKKIEAGIYK